MCVAINKTGMASGHKNIVDRKALIRSSGADRVSGIMVYNKLFLKIEHHLKHS